MEAGCGDQPYKTLCCLSFRACGRGVWRAKLGQIRCSHLSTLDPTTLGWSRLQPIAGLSFCVVPQFLVHPSLLCLASHLHLPQMPNGCSMRGIWATGNPIQWMVQRKYRPCRIPAGGYLVTSVLCYDRRKKCSNPQKCWTTRWLNRLLFSPLLPPSSRQDVRNHRLRVQSDSLWSACAHIWLPRSILAYSIVLFS